MSPRPALKVQVAENGLKLQREAGGLDEHASFHRSASCLLASKTDASGRLVFAMDLFHASFPGAAEWERPTGHSFAKYTKADNALPQPRCKL